MYHSILGYITIQLIRNLNEYNNNTLFIYIDTLLFQTNNELYKLINVVCLFNIFSFVSYIFYSIISCDDQFLKIPVTINDNGIPTISIDIGIPHQSFSFLLSSTLSGVLIISNKNTMGGYDETKSHSFKSLEPIKLSYID